MKQQITSTDQVGAILKAARTSAGIKQEDLSLATGRSVKLISQIENGKAFGSLKGFLDLMQAAGAKVLVEFPGAKPADEESER